MFGNLPDPEKVLRGCVIVFVIVAGLCLGIGVLVGKYLM